MLGHVSLQSQINRQLRSDIRSEVNAIQSFTIHQRDREYPLGLFVFALIRSLLRRVPSHNDRLNHIPAYVQTAFKA
jgi:hypothetical protein